MHYGVDIDRAMAGEHTAHHIAVLAEHLPSHAAVHRAKDPDAVWRLEHVLLANIANTLNALICGLGGGKVQPTLIGPSYMTKTNGRTIEARAMKPDALMELLARPRR